jgi:iron complex transport system ATP-binding protein
LVARSLVAQPRLLLLDEPLANLDPYWVLRTLELMREAAKDGSAVIASLHDLSQLTSFDRVILVYDGRIAADGTAGEILESDELGVAFRVERHNEGWRISLPADLRSSP